jgi:hypothetical protein
MITGMFWLLELHVDAFYRWYLSPTEMPETIVASLIACRRRPMLNVQLKNDTVDSFPDLVS